MSIATKELYELGETPPLGHVPPRMHAMLIRRERFGEPKTAFQPEVVETPAIGPREALVYVMAAGINYNNVWAALGVPVDVIKSRMQSGDDTGFHIGGSDASGIVYAVGAEVTNVKVGDEVVIHCGAWDPERPDVKAADDPMFAPSFQIWGYETNWGSFAQFTKVWAHQCMPKAPHLSWEAAAAPTLVGSTVYRMLTNWAPHTVRQNDVVLGSHLNDPLARLDLPHDDLAGMRPAAATRQQQLAVATELEDVRDTLGVRQHPREFE